MRRISQDDYKKLLPLKKIAEASSYSFGYVSILVQRKKLKAKKIGNKYYSTKEWFDQYLELHGRDGKKLSEEAVQELNSNQAGSLRLTSQTTAATNLKSQIDNLVNLAIKEKLEAQVAPPAEFLKWEDLATMSRFGQPVEPEETAEFFSESFGVKQSEIISAPAVGEIQEKGQADFLPETKTGKKDLAEILNSEIKNSSLDALPADEVKFMADLEEPETKLAGEWKNNFHRGKKELEAVIKPIVKVKTAKKETTPAKFFRHNIEQPIVPQIKKLLSLILKTSTVGLVILLAVIASTQLASQNFKFSPARELGFGLTRAFQFGSEKVSRFNPVERLNFSSIEASFLNSAQTVKLKLAQAFKFNSAREFQNDSARAIEARSIKAVAGIKIIASQSSSSLQFALGQAKHIADSILPEQYLEPVSQFKNKALALAGLKNFATSDSAGKVAGVAEMVPPATSLLSESLIALVTNGASTATSTAVVTSSTDSIAVPIATTARNMEILAMIADKKGKIADGEYDIRFALYNKSRAAADPYPSNADQANKVWEETQKVTIKNGALRTYLGMTTNLPLLTILASDQYYLGIRIGGDSEMTPRKKMPAPLYAFNAINASQLGGRVTGAQAGNIPVLNNQGKNLGRLDYSLMPTEVTDFLFKAGAIGQSTTESPATTTLPIVVIDTDLGGTGLTSYQKGDMLYYDSGKTLARMAIGQEGQVLSIINGLPVWSNPKSSTVSLGGGGSSIRSTSELAEGTNLYWTDARFDTKFTTAIAATGVWTLSGLDAYRLTGNVGIGTTSPYSLLSIQSTTGGITPLFTIASSTAGAANSTYFTVVNNGFIGIGTTSPAYTVDINGNLHIGNGRIYFDDGTSMNTAGLGNSGAVSSNTDAVITGDLLNAGVGGVILKTGPNIRLIVLNNGNVGVGSSTPGALFSVGSTGQGLQIDNSGTVISGTWNGSTIAVANGGTGLASFTPGDMLYASGPTTLAKIASSTDGKILMMGFGTGIPAWTSTTSLNIAVSSITGVLGVDQGGIGQDSSTWNGPVSVAGGVWQATTSIGVMYGGTGLSAGGLKTGYIPFGAGESPLATSTNLFWDNGNSRLGIGTTTPAYTVDINGDLRIASGRLYFTDGTSMNTAGLGAAGSISNNADAVITGDLLDVGTGGVILKTGPNIRLIVLNNGNVGVGSSTPGALFSVGSTGQGLQIDNSGTVISGTWNGSTIAVSNGGTGQSSYAAGDIIYANAADSLAKLGIGTAGYVLTSSGGLPTWLATSTIGVQGRGNGAANQVAYFSDANTITSSASYLWNDTTKLLTVTGNASTTQLTTTGSTYLATTGGNVGIGTTNPGTQLYVLAPAQASTNVPVDVMTLDVGAPTSGTATGYGPAIMFKDFFSTVQSDMGRIAAVYEDNGKYTSGLAFYANGDSNHGGLAEKMRITGTGNVGIGTTSPYSILSISNSASTAVNTPLFTIASTTAGNSTTTLLTVLANGKVGIGTAAPVYQLHVLAPRQVSSNNPVDVFAVEIGLPTSGSKAGYGPSIIFKDGSTETTHSLARIAGIYETYMIGATTYNSGALSFYTNTENPDSLIERMRISNTGNVGIGTTTPWKTLSVSGDLSLTGAFYDSLASAGSNLQILQSTGSATKWVATSTLNVALVNTTGTLAINRGGTGLSSIPGYGQILVGTEAGAYALQATSTLGLIADIDFNANGLMARTAAGTYAPRTITGTANEITVVNGDGTADNPTISLPDVVYLGSSGQLGRDADNLLDFSTDNQLTFRINAAGQMLLNSSGLAIAGQLSAATTTLAGDLVMNGKKITGLANPTAAQEGATKAYVDAIAQGLQLKDSVRAATRENITLSGTQTVDNVALLAGDRVLVKAQSDAATNGIYVVAAGDWSRAEDADTSAEVTSGMYTFTQEGSIGEGNGYVLITPNPIILDATNLSFAQFSGAGQIIAGNGLIKFDSNTLAAVGTLDRITVNADSIDIASTYAGQSSITMVGVLGAGSISSNFGAIDIGADALTAGAGSFTSLTNSGTLTVSGSTSLNGAAAILGSLTADGATFSGNLTMGNNYITGLADPVAAQDAATKSYVDSVAQGLTLKDSVLAATLVDITLSGEQTIDGVALVAGNRVLVKNQTDSTTNGIYVVAAGDWSRSTDADISSEVPAGTYTFVTGGGSQSNTGWILTTPNPITLGTTGLTFSQFSASAEFIAGDGLIKTGNIFDVVGTADRITANANSIDIAANYIGQDSITTVGALTTGSIAAGFGNINIAGNSLTAGAGTFASLTASGASTVYNQLTASYFTATSTTATSTFPYLRVSGQSDLGTVTVGTWQGSTIGVAYGGTGATSFTTRGILYGNDTAAVSSTLAGTYGQVLMAGVGGLPAFVSTSTLKISLIDTTDTLEVNRGGTGLTAVGASSTVMTTDGAVMKWNQLAGSQLINDLGWTSNSGTVTDVTGIYPIISSGGAAPAISLAFGTTTPNTWGALQTFTNASSTLFSTVYASSTNLYAGIAYLPNLGLPAGTFLAVNSAGQIIATTSPTGGVGGIGTVTSVDMTVPTGLTIGGNPITTSGTLALTFTGGYSIPLSASTTEGSTAYTRSVSSWTSPLQFNAGTASILPANTSQAGYLSSFDWNIFNDKISSSSLSAIWPLAYNSSTGQISSATSSATSAGVLSAADWISFNNKWDLASSTIGIAYGGTGLTTVGASSTVMTTDGAVMKWNTLAGSQLTNDLGWTSNSGTVTSVDMTVPTGLTIGGNPITTSGTLALTFTGGYSIPLSASTTEGSTAYTRSVSSWTSPLQFSNGIASILQSNTAQAGYLTSADWNTFNNKWDLASSTIGNAYLTNSTIGLTSSGSLTVGTSPISLGGSSALNLNMANPNTWTALQTFGNASTTQISSTGSAYFATATGNVGIGTTTPTLATLDVNGNIAIENQNGLRFYELGGNGVNYAALTASSSMTGDVTWTLPNADGTVGQVLATNAAGNLYWTGGASNWTDATTFLYPADNSGQQYLLIGGTTDATSEVKLNYSGSSWFTGGYVGLGTTTPQALLHLGTASSTSLTSYGNSLMVSGQLEVQGTAYLGPMEFPADSGVISWIDMPVSTTVATGTVESYTAGIGGTGILTVYAEASGYLGGVIATSTKLVVSAMATSTFANGIDLSGGCFAIGGVCVAGGGAGGGGLGWASTTIPNTNSIYSLALSNVGIGTTSPYAKLSIDGLGTATTLFAIANSTGVATTTLFTVSNTGLTTVGDPSGTGDANFQFAADANAWDMGYNSADKSFNIASSTSFTTNVAFTILKNNLNVGIGTTTPSAPLDIARLLTAGTTGNMLSISTSTTGYIFRVDTYGNVFADGAYTGRGTAVVAGSADYAEYFYTNTPDLKSGEVVCVDILENNAVIRCERGHDNNVMGIVSTKPAIVGNDQSLSGNDMSHYAIIGMLGQVDAFVSAENGAVNIGDSLTSASSTPGYAMKADGGDSTVGVALEPLKQGTGKIKVLISRRNKSLAVEEVDALVVERIANMKIEDQVQQMIKSAVDNLNLDPKISEIAQAEANKLDAILTVNINDLSGAITNLRTQTLASISDLYNKTSDILKLSDSWAANLASTTALAENIKIDEQGNLVIGASKTSDVLGSPHVSVQIIDPTEIMASSTQAVFVVNQTGSGAVADFQSAGVSVMNIADSGEVKIMGSLLVDGRIMLCTGGQCSNTLDSAVDETMADLGVEGKVVAGAFEGYCADGYIWVPGSAKYGTLPGFCVMSDLMNISGSTANERSNRWVNVSQGEAQVACQTLGAGYHLLGENEWLTMAENILQVAENDINKDVAGMQLATGTLDVLTDVERPYKLTNDNIIYNLAGSVAEWTNQNVTAAGLPVAPARDAWYEYSEVTDYKGMSIAPTYYLTDQNNNIGKIYTGSGTGLRGFVRGFGGIYGLDLSHAPSEQSENIGFRCGK